MSAHWAPPLSLREPKYAQRKIRIKYQSVPTRIIQKAVSQKREFNSLLLQLVNVFVGTAVTKCHQPVAEE